MAELTANSPKQSLGQRISDLRKRQGLPLARLAKVCELSEENTIAHRKRSFCCERAAPLSLSKYLKVDIADFFKGRFSPLTPGIGPLQRMETDP
ncbi:MAG: hypothetical protein Ct9H300mP13_1540 [Gammaproteobacteria bacterium]|nr:MAG: hypothetical protein Ct9H300mP13_1540 [Gammaproteobacteria bacterium]